MFEIHNFMSWLPYRLTVFYSNAPRKELDKITFITKNNKELFS